MPDSAGAPPIPTADVDAIFTDRWSPRAFRSEPLSAHEVASLFEAARWAPSCFNEQPWLFVYATEGADLDRIRGLLVEKNRMWADKAPLLAILFAKKTFTRNGSPNRHGPFDAGAAWMSLALQARRLGLFSHAMAGFDAQRAPEALGVPGDDWEAMAAIAVGRRDDPATLPEGFAAVEGPSPRRPQSAIAMPGRFKPELR